MRIRVSAVAVETDAILTIRFFYSGRDVFALPGGAVQRGEPIRETLQREWNDELGLRITPGDLLLVGDAPGDKKHPRTLHIVFRADEIRGKPRIIRGESGGEEIVWIPLSEAAEIPFYPDVGASLSELLAGRLQPRFLPNCMERGFW